jgi:hypothetical protein
LSIPVLTCSSNSKSSFWMNKWFFSLCQSEWLLSIPMLASSCDCKSSFWMNKWLSLSSNKSSNSNGFHYFYYII